MKQPLTIAQIKASPETTIGWMCYDVFITTDNQVLNLSFEPVKEVLRGGSYCFRINGTYRTKKWIKENCISVKGLIFND